MLDPSTLYDPSTKKCCPNKCRKTVAQMDQAITGLATSIVQLLSGKALQLEEQLNATTETVCRPITEKLQQLEERIDAIYRPIQNGTMEAYARLINDTERITSTNRPQSSPNKTPEESTIGEVPLTTYDETVERTQSATMPTTSYDTQSGLRTSQTQPTQAESSTSQYKPTQADTKTTVPCVRIDLCDELREQLDHLIVNVSLLFQAIKPVVPVIARLAATLNVALPEPVKTEGKDGASVADTQYDPNVNRAVLVDDKLGYYYDANNSGEESE